MKIRTFIDRPILACVISVLLVILGVIGLLQLPVEQFPEIAPPTVRVSANYTGANAETVQKSVIVPIEEAINGAENMMYMTSTASNSGSASVSVFFRQGTDPSMAMVDVQNRVATVQGKLPSDVVKGGLNVRKRQTTNIKQMTLYSPTDSYDRIFLANYGKINLEPRISRIAGVGDVTVIGADYSMRIWLDPNKMAMYGVTPKDISTVLDEQNVEAATGTLGAESDYAFQYVLKYRGRYEEEPDFENMVIKSLPDGNVLRIKDVARVELGGLNYTFLGETAGHQGVNFMINQTAGSNANEIITAIDNEVVQIRKDLPKGIVIEDLESKKDFLDASIKNVVKTLIEALLLVILVVYIFLQNLRSTIIPTIAIIVSLVGTFAFLYIIGFSLNLLTLFALVLVIGTVVDDAIVVVEAVQARFDAGYQSAYDATVDAMGGITSALITTTLVFMAVFIPVCFIGGVSGKFYVQFGVTMAIAVAISCLNALTLSPALCALIMRPHADVAKGEKLGFSSRFHLAFDSAFQRMSAKYVQVFSLLFRRKWIAWLLVAASVVGLAWLMKSTRTGLVPAEDMGSILVNVQTAPGTSLTQTHKVLKQVEQRIQDIDAIKIYSLVAGTSVSHEQSSSNGNITIKLKSWKERTGEGQDQASVIKEIYRRTADITTAKIQVSAQSTLPGFGRINGLDINVQDRKGGTMADLAKYTNQFVEALNKRPEISRAYTNFSDKYPQYRVEVDAATCKRNGVSPTDVLSALSGYIGGTYASNFNRFTKLYRVMVQASPEFRADEQALQSIYVKNSSGTMSPVSQYVTLTKVNGSETLSRFNLFPSIAVGGTPAEGYSSGQAIEAVKEVAAQVLPAGYNYEFGGMTRQEAEASGTTTLVFIMCIVFIYLILCALYESLFIPLAVILSVPFGLAGSFIFAKIWGLENNIYMQTGLIMLIGLLAKTAILLTEYASERRREGMTIAHAAIAAAKVRLRPILMTSATMVFGLLPMAFASGVGANGNRSLGVGVIGGMLLGTIALLLLVPVLFVVMQWLEERVMPRRRANSTQNLQ